MSLDLSQEGWFKKEETAFSYGSVSSIFKIEFWLLFTSGSSISSGSVSK